MQSCSSSTQNIRFNRLSVVCIQRIQYKYLHTTAAEHSQLPYFGSYEDFSLKTELKPLERPENIIQHYIVQSRWRTGSR